MASGAVALVAVAVVVLAWFQPQKLVLDDAVDEPAPTAPARAPGGAGGDAAASTFPADLAEGSFVSLDHSTSGVARVLDLGDGDRVVRLETLATDNGPDLYLYLSANPADGEEQAFDDEFISLGRLKGNQGDQNYDLPADVDLGRYSSIVIWCDRFNSAFGAAPLV